MPKPLPLAGVNTSCGALDVLVTEPIVTSVGAIVSAVAKLFLPVPDEPAAAV
jgi:hypothetical protein